MTNHFNLDELFESPILYPDILAKDRLAALVGLDEHKNRLINILSILVNPQGLQSWFHKHHPNATHIISTIIRRPKLIVLAGDVGTGKTELAETIADAVARQENIKITLFPLSLSARGQGRVGEMTQLLSSAFDYTIKEANKGKSSSDQARRAVILLVDEADAIAQSREASQMHHEDRAGVNAFIRGIDKISINKLPAAVLMCTNRLGALDPAIKRRAADIITFERPDENQRHSMLELSLKELGFTDKQINEIVVATGKNDGRDYGFTSSDLIQRFLPMVVLDAYPNNPVEFTKALEIANKIHPTPPFQDE